MTGIVAVLLVVLAALPDDAPATSSSRGHGIVAMQTAMPAAVASRFVAVSVSPFDVDQPPGDGRDLGAAIPTVLRLPVSAVLAEAMPSPPPPVNSALPERPPKSV